MARARTKRSNSNAHKTKPFCSIPPRTIQPLTAAMRADPHRARAILVTKSKWVNGTVLHYCFFKSGHYVVPKAQAAAVRKAFAKWKAIGIGLQFKEVNDLSEAEIRIGYSLKDEDSSSGIGREILTVPLDEPTTVYGWDLTSKYGSGTALHELGHVLGMEHEHQNPFAGIKWHEQAVYKALAKSPNKWKHSETYHNILEKLSPQQVQGSEWDPDSIMEYEFEAGLIEEPKKYEDGLVPPGTLSAADRKWALKWYPPLKKKPRLLKALQPALLKLSAGEQVDFAIKPASSRKYTIEVKGASDAVLVLFEDVKGVPRYLSGDDDSGEAHSASIAYRLFKDRTYIARVRLSHPGPTGMTSITYS
jgi:hypothetical protein